MTARRHTLIHGSPLIAASLILSACGSSGVDTNDVVAAIPANNTSPVSTESNPPTVIDTTTDVVIDDGANPNVVDPGTTPSTGEGGTVVGTPNETPPPAGTAPPDDIEEPVEPVQPVQPVEPIEPVEPVAPVVTSTRVTFNITVPAFMSEELQLDVFVGDTELDTSWVIDETWTTEEVVPANSETELRVVFYDHYGSTTLATYDSLLETFSQENQTVLISAEQFDSESWDNDGDDVSNLEESRLGTDPDFAEIAGAPIEPAGVTSIQYSGYDLELFWSRGSDEDGVVIGYDIFRDDEQITDRLDALSFYDGSVQPETDYTYDIYSVDNDGLRSRAATVAITTPADEPVNGVAANYATLQGGGESSWFISDGLTTTNNSWSSGSCSSSEGAGSGVGITDARLPSNGDAYDYASLMWINGEQVGGWLRSATSSTSNFAPVPIAGLQVATEYHAISSLPVLRNYTALTNDSAEDIFVVINVATNFGADGGNRIITSSSGDTTFGADDRWVITDDSNNGGWDPANTTVFYGPDSPASPAVFTNDSVFNCWGSQGLTARIDVSVPAGETRALMLFHGLSTTQDNARSLATEFNTTPTIANALTEGMTEAQLTNVVNWDY